MKARWDAHLASRAMPKKPPACKNAIFAKARLTKVMEIPNADVKLRLIAKFCAWFINNLMLLKENKKDNRSRLAAM